MLWVSRAQEALALLMRKRDKSGTQEALALLVLTLKSVQIVAMSGHTGVMTRRCAQEAIALLLLTQAESRYQEASALLVTKLKTLRSVAMLGHKGLVRTPRHPKYPVLPSLGPGRWSAGLF